MAYILEANVFKIQLVYIGIYAVKNYILKKLFIKIYSQSPDLLQIDMYKIKNIYIF